MLIGQLRAGLPIRAFLALPGLLLHALVGPEKPRLAVAQNRTEGCSMGEVVFHLHGDVRAGTAVREIFLHWRIEVAVGVGESSTEADKRPRPSVLCGTRTRARPETARRSDSAPVQSLARVAGCDELDHAPQLSTVLSGVSAGDDAHGVHIVGVQFRRKRR